MKNKYLIIPKSMSDTKKESFHFLFPLKGYCVGYEFEVSFESLSSESYILINRLFDKEGILALEKLLLQNEEKIKGVVFEDLGVFEILKKFHKKVESIYFPSHGMCSVPTVNCFLSFVDTVVLSPDITLEEIDEILAHAKNEICLYGYGPLPYLYSRRRLLTNFQKNELLDLQSKMTVHEKVTDKHFRFVENDFGTVCYDKFDFDGRVLFDKPNVKYLILNFSNADYDNFEEWMRRIEQKEEILNTTTGFLYQKTIYRLPPRKDSL